MADQLKPQWLHRKLDRCARQFCPPVALLDSGYSYGSLKRKTGAEEKLCPDSPYSRSLQASFYASFFFLAFTGSF